MHLQTSQGLFLFDTSHREFVAGNETVLPTAVTRKIAVRQYVYLMFFVAFPLILLITLLVAIAGYRIEFLLVVELLTALITCAYFVLSRYWKDRELRRKGDIIYGEIIRQDILPSYSGIGVSTITRLFYRFITPNKERTINFIECAHITNRMPDGRKYPKVGTPVAILYASKKNHKLL